MKYAFTLLRVGAFLVDSIIPVAITYWAFRVSLIFMHSSQYPLNFKNTFNTIHSVLFAYASLELLFLIYFHFKLRQFQKESIIKPLPPQIREMYINKIFKQYDKTTFAKFITGWFYIKSTNLQLDASDADLIMTTNFKEW